MTNGQEKVETKRGAQTPWSRYPAIVPLVPAGFAALLILALLWGGNALGPWFPGTIALVLGGILSLTFFLLFRATARRKSLDQYLDGESDCLLIETPGGVPIYANLAFRRLVADSAADSPPRLPSFESLEKLLSDDNAAAALRSLRDAARDGQSASRIVPVSVAGDIEATFEISVKPLPGNRRAWRVRGLGTPLAAAAGEQSWTERLEEHGQGADFGLYTLDREGRFLYANRTMVDWIGRPLSDIVGGELRITELYDSASAGNALKPGIFSVTLSTADGRKRFLQVSQSTAPEGEPRIHAVARRVGTGDALAGQFQKLFKDMPVGVALLDGNLVIEDCNGTFREFVEDSDSVGRSILHFIHQEQKDAVAEDLQSVLDGKSSGKSLEARLDGPNESVAGILVGRLRGDKGAPASLLLLVSDSTEQKNMEAQLVQSQKMQAVGQLAGGIAHDFNNVLTAMIGFCDLLLHRHRPGDQSFADIMQIKQNANRAAALVRQLLAFSRQQTLQPRFLNVTEVLAELSNLLRRLLGEKIELSMVHGRDLGLIKGDQGQLEQVIINLAVNARDAMLTGGRLTISTGNVEVKRARQAHGEVMPAGEYVQVSVSDTGMGIPKENFARIFEPFFTTKEVGQGTGLGLSTVYGIVKQTGGFLFVDSKGKGKGATFDLYLKRHHVDVAEIESTVDGEVVMDLTGGGTVLLVEDEDPVRLFSARALRNKGYKVVEAKTGEAALELLNGGEYDLLVTDMVMPRVDGAEVIREARKLLPDLPVICISGYTEDSVLKEVESLDNLRFLSKPFSLKQLALAVKESIATGETRHVGAGK